MQLALLVLICLVCTCRGRRVQSTSEYVASMMSADVDSASQVGRLAGTDQGEHEVFPMESGRENKKKVGRDSHIQALRAWWNSMNPANAPSFAKALALSSIAWVANTLWPLCVIAFACVLLFVFCFVRKRGMSKERGPGPEEASTHPRREHADANCPEVMWTVGQSSLPVLSNILERWDATQDKDPATFISNHEERFKASTETTDTADNGETGEAVESASTVSSIVDDVTPRVILEPSGISPILLNYSMAKSLLKYLPAGQRVPGASVWKLCYKPIAHGTSMATLHRMLAGCERTLLLVRDADDHVFGGFAPLPWKVGRRFHGSGEAFVFKFGKLANLAATSDAEVEEVQDPADPIEVKVFPWTQLNHHFMYASPRLLAMGGGDGQYALAIHEGLLRGHSSSTPTFGNPPLSSVQGGDFVLKDMEVWSLE